MQNRYVDDTIQFLFHCVLACLFCLFVCLFVFKTDGRDFFPFFPCCVLPSFKHVVMVDRLLINLLTLLNFALITCFCGLIFCLVCFLFLF